AFVQPDLHRLNLVQHLCGALCQQVGQTGCAPGVDQRCSVFLLEALGEGKLLGLEGIARQVGAEVHIVSSQTQCCAHDDLIKDRRRRVDDELAVASYAHDAVEITRIDLGDGDSAPLAQKAASPLHVAVPAPDCMPLFLQQLCEKGAGGAGTEDED